MEGGRHGKSLALHLLTYLMTISIFSKKTIVATLSISQRTEIQPSARA